MSRHYGRTLLLLAPALLDTYWKEGIRGEGPCGVRRAVDQKRVTQPLLVSLLLCSNYVLLAVLLAVAILWPAVNSCQQLSAASNS